MNVRLCKLCVALARENRSYCRTVDELISDAQSLLRAGDSAREALERGKSPQSAFARARKIAEFYRIGTVERTDTEGVVLGLTFSSPHYLSGADNVYKIA